MSAETLAMRLFGPPQIHCNGQPLAVTRRKSRALLYYLAAHTAPVTREQALALLWPDHDRAAAQQVLRTTLHGLRKALGSALVISDEALALAPNVLIDVRRFEAGLAQSAPSIAALLAALEEYRGDFLADFSLPDAPPFEDWLLAERERYRRMAVRGLTALSRRYESQQQHDAALDALARALAFDPLQEDLQRTAMWLHYQAGDRAGAIRRYEALRRLLDDELGVPPMAETRALYDAIVTDDLRLPEQRPPAFEEPWATDPLGVIAQGATPAAAAPPAAAPAAALVPFVGRAGELATLGAGLAAHQLVLIEGEPGIGKSRLAQEFITASGAIALVGAAHELEQALPYHPVIEALRGLQARPDWPELRTALVLPAVWLAEIVRLLPELGCPTEYGGFGLAAAAPADESRLWEGISQLLLALARRHPVALFLDDLQWADAATLGLLGYLTRRAAAAPLLLLAASRPVAPRSTAAALFQALTREGRLARLTLTRLGGEAMLALARQLSPHDPAPLAEWLLRTSEGNPFIMVELLRDASQHGTLAPANLAAVPPLPQTVYSLIESRLARLSDAARRVLDAAVAAGREFPFAVVAQAAGLSDAAALDALDELRAAALIIERDDETYAFDHSLTMEVAYREVGEARHRRLHRQVAAALESIHRQQLNGVAGLIATHLAEGGDPVRAAPYALLAARQASRLAAWQAAIGFYRQALAGLPDEGRADTLVALGDAYLQAGEFVPALEALHQALDLVERGAGGPDLRADAVRLMLAQALLPLSRFREVIALAHQVRASGALADADQAEFVWGTALSLEGADLVGAASHLQAAEALCRQRACPPDTLARISFELGSVAAQQGRLDEAVVYYRAALASAQDAVGSRADQWRILAHNNLGYHLLLLGDPQALSYAQEGMRLAQEAGALVQQPFLFSTLGEIALAAGDLTQAEQHFEAGLALAERLGIPERIAGLTANLGLLAQRRGQDDLAVARLTAALEQADAVGTRHLAAQVRLWLVPLLPPAQAQARLAEARAIAESGGRQRLLEQAARLGLEARG